MNNLELKIRYPGGSFVLKHLRTHECLHDLKTEIAHMIKCHPSAVVLRYGFPPQIVDLEDNTTLENAGLESGITVNVDVDESRCSENISRPENLLTGQQPDPDGLIMIRRIIPADNSCLFNCIGYALEGKSKTKAPHLRNVVCKYIKADQELYNEAFLGKSNSEYIKWIQKDSSWGGAIEIDIFSREYKTEICAIDIKSLVPNIFGQDKQYNQRIYLLYDGIHYDVICRNISEEMDEDLDITVFSPKDKYAYEGALALARELNQKQQFTDTSSFNIECGICYKRFKGEKEVVDHNKETGHMNFREVERK